MRSFEADLVLDGGDSCVEEKRALLNLGLLSDKVLHLLPEEVVLIDVHVLQLAEVVLQVDHVLHDLLQRLVVQLHCLVLECRKLTSE